MALTPPQGGNPNPPSIATPMQPQIPTPPRQQPLMQPSPLGQQAQAYSPFSNQTNNNASASPFNQSNQPQATAGQAGFKAPAFTGPIAGDASKALIQSQNNLIQAINKLTQGIGNIGRGTTGGTPGAAAGTATNANPSNTTTAVAGVGTQQNQDFSKRAKAIAGFASGLGGSTLGDIIGSIPYVGGLLAAPYNAAAGKAGSVANLQALNRESFFASGKFGGGTVKDNADLRNFARMGIGPDEALRMQIEAKNVGFGRNLTSGPNSSLAFGANLSQFAQMGFGGTTAGLTSAISERLNPAAINANRIFAFGANMGLNDVSMQGLLGNVLGIQKSTSMMGGNLSGRAIENLMGAMSYKGGLMGESVAGIFGAMSNIGKTESPFGNLAEQVIQSQAALAAPGDIYGQAKYMEELSGDPLKKFKLLQQRLGTRAAKESLLGQGLTTQQIDALVAGQEGEFLATQQMPEAMQYRYEMRKNKEGKMERVQVSGIKGIGLAEATAGAALGDATTFAQQIELVFRKNRELEENKLSQITEKGINELIEMSKTTTDVVSGGFNKLMEGIDKISKALNNLKMPDFSEIGKSIATTMKSYLPKWMGGTP
jgi:hypothetical protein